MIVGVLVNEFTTAGILSASEVEKQRLWSISNDSDAKSDGKESKTCIPLLRACLFCSTHASFWRLLSEY
jgi:hypothetical protein